MRHFIASVVLMGGMLVLPGVGEGAVISRVNKDQTRIILELNQAELKELEESEEVIVEIGNPVFLLTGILQKLDPVKKTVVVVFAEPDLRLEKRQRVRFLPFYSNSQYSPSMMSYAHYHQYGLSRFGAALGYDLYNLKTADDDDSESFDTRISGSTIRLDGYLHLFPDFFGGGFGYERQTLKAVIGSGDDESEISVIVNRLKPGFWAEVEQHWRLGLRFDYTLLEVTSEKETASGDVVHNYEFAQPLLSAVWYDDRFEAGFHYFSGGKSDSTVSVLEDDGGRHEEKGIIKVPAELHLVMRRVSTPDLIWGLSLGYIFYERKLDDDLELRRKPKPAEQIRMRAPLEMQLAGGSRTEFALFYDGGKKMQGYYFEQHANAGGLEFSWSQKVLTDAVWGVQTVVYAGSAKVEDRFNSGSEVVTTYTGSGGRVVVFFDIPLDFKPGKSGI